MKVEQQKEVVKELVIAMEEHKEEWASKWVSLESPANAYTGREYQGFNRLHLTLVSLNYGYNTNLWAGFSQIKKNNNKVEKGSRGVKISVPVILKEKKDESEKKPEQGEEEKAISFYKSLSIFNLDQTADKPESKGKISEVTDEKVLTEIEKLSENANKDNISWGYTSGEFITDYPGRCEVPYPTLFRDQEDFISVFFRGLSEAVIRRDTDSAEESFYSLSSVIASALYCKDKGFKYITTYDKSLVRESIENLSNGIFTIGEAFIAAREALKKLDK